MRPWLAATALTVALLGAAASGCTTAPPTAPEPTKPTLGLIVEPQAGYQPIYDTPSDPTLAVPCSGCWTLMAPSSPVPVYRST